MRLCVRAGSSLVGIATTSVAVVVPLGTPAETDDEVADGETKMTCVVVLVAGPAPDETSDVLVAVGAKPAVGSGCGAAIGAPATVVGGSAMSCISDDRTKGGCREQERSSHQKRRKKGRQGERTPNRAARRRAG